LFQVAIPVGLIWAPAADAQDLAEVYQKAVMYDARFASARGAYAAGVEKLPQGRSQLLPALTVNAEKMYSDSKITYETTSPFESGSRDYEDLKYSATLTQPLYRKQNFAVYWQSKAQKEAAEAQMSLARQDLLLRVAQAYFDLLSAQQVQAAAVANTAAMKAQENKAKVQLALGSGSRLEASEAGAKHEMARARELAARHDLINKQQAVRRITNEIPGTLHELRPGFPLVQAGPNDVLAWTKIAEQENPQLQALRANMEAAKQEIERAQGGHYPTLDLVAQYSNAHSTGSVYTSATSDTMIKSAGVRLEMPLYQGGVVNSRVREAVGNLEKARGELEDAQRDVMAQITQHFNGVVNGIEQVRALEQALASSREASRANRIGLEIGTRNLVDLLNAEQQVYEVTRDLAKARQEYIMSRLRLRAYAGKLAEDELLVLNSYLVPPSASSPTGANPTETTPPRGKGAPGMPAARTSPQ
jgi:outer membrane protein